MKVASKAQYTAEFWDARRGVPSSSEFHRIITPKKWEQSTTASSYVYDLIADLYDPSYGMHEEYASRAMAAGTQREPEARRYYEFARGLDVEEVGFCTTDDGRFGCSPDALVCEEGGLECKCPTLKTQVKWLLGGTVPPEHLAQCHGFLIVTGRAWIDFLSYSPPLAELLVRVERDDKTEKLAAALESFWVEYQATITKIKSTQQPPLTRTVGVGEFQYEESVYPESPF